VAYLVPRLPYVLYDGTNSAAVLALTTMSGATGGDPAGTTLADLYDVVSEAGGVLTLRVKDEAGNWEWDPQPIHAGQTVVIDNGGTVRAYSAADLAARYRELP